MMSILYSAFFLSFFGVTYSLPTDFRHVTFIKKQNNRISLDYILPPFDLEYKAIDFLPKLPAFQDNVQHWNSLGDGFPNHGLNFELQLPVDIKEGHFTPDYSNGLEYPDPFLLHGLQAKRAARVLYSKELFFSDIPHVRAVLYNQEERKRNGLAKHRIGSLNTRSLFSRDNYILY